MNCRIEHNDKKKMPNKNHVQHRSFYLDYIDSLRQKLTTKQVEEHSLPFSGLEKTKGEPIWEKHAVVKQNSNELSKFGKKKKDHSK